MGARASIITGGSPDQRKSFVNNYIHSSVMSRSSSKAFESPSKTYDIPLKKQHTVQPEKRDTSFTSGFLSDVYRNSLNQVSKSPVK